MSLRITQGVLTMAALAGCSMAPGQAHLAEIERPQGDGP